MTQTKHRICPICEAGCGLKVSVENNHVIAIEKNSDDVFSEGHVCAKGLSLAQLHDDSDRLRHPLVRKNGELQPASWQEALDTINTKLAATIDAFGKSSVAIYAGNPTAHNFGLSQGLGVFAAMLGGSPVFSAGSVDQLPKQLACEFMFGNSSAVPVPDIERCDYLLMLGANPIVSNGSLWMVPKFRDRLRALQKRGGQLVTIDPRRTETARLADQHYPIQPGTDAWLLIALINELKVDGQQAGYLSTGWEILSRHLDDFDSEKCAAQCGISLDQILLMAQALRRAQRPVVYGRVGTTLQAFGTMTSFLIEVLNAVIGSLDMTGGAMFPDQPHAMPGGRKHGVDYNRFQTRVSGYPEVLGQMPAAAMAEEILTPGSGQIKAMVAFAGNPAVSHPDSDGIEAALGALDFLLCVDIYHNETSKYADVILPGTSPFEDSHYDSFLGSMGYRNAARYSPAILKCEQPSEWHQCLHIAYMVNHQAVASTEQLKAFEDDLLAGLVSSYCADENSPLFNRDVQELMAMIEPDEGVERLLDLGIRAGRWGDHFGSAEGAKLTLKKVETHPNGIDLGLPEAARLADVVGHQNHKIDFAPEPIIADFSRLKSQLTTDGFKLIGRRRSQSNNSWLRNIPMLTGAKNHCALEVNHHDALQLNLSDGDEVVICGNDQTLQASVLISHDIASGVVSLPHGFSEDDNMRQARNQKGPNYNRLVPSSRIDVVSASAALNGVPVRIEKLQ